MSQFTPAAGALPTSTATPTYAGFWIRLLASLIDGVLLNVVLYLLATVLGLKLVDYSYDAATGSYNAATGGSGMTLVSVLIGAAFSIGFWMWRGATPGKMLFGMQVVRADTGAPITAAQAVGRYAGYFLSGLALGLGFLWVAFDGRKQGWHDKLASTVVVRRRG